MKASWSLPSSEPAKRKRRAASSTQVPLVALSSARCSRKVDKDNATGGTTRDEAERSGNGFEAKFSFGKHSATQSRQGEAESVRLSVIQTAEVIRRRASDRRSIFDNMSFIRHLNTNDYIFGL